MVTAGPASETTIRCPGCGAANRVRQEPVERGLAPVCGRCGSPLPTSSAGVGKPTSVTDATFAAEVERAALPVLVDFWAPWCPPCRMIAPVIDELAAELAGRVRVAKVNIDESPGVAERFGVASIPTLIVFKGGREVDRMVGVQAKAVIAERLKRVG